MKTSLQGRAGAVILLCVILAAALAPFLFPGDPQEMSATPYLWPGDDWAHPLGSDLMGRDIAAGLLHGARVSLLVGASAAGLTLLIGVVLGTLAGYFGGWLDNLLMRLTDFFQIVPRFLLVIILVSLLQPSIWVVVVALGTTSWTHTARVVRAQVLGLRNREYIQAGLAAGMSHLRIILRHILPNALTPILVSTSIVVAGCILAESGLAFLGLGDPNAISWGAMIGTGREAIRTGWYMIAIPGVAVMLTVWSLNVLGDALNQYFNPKLRD
ncbi:peptide/nickel transport system permease protein [Pseudoduganella lurida]|uniref:Peptide/nickel transport system permease protein n=1 Tax=Pseudoduganella lurida TaxID=1036180 RepID=A0A562RFJ2_9BURK|nr:ABC transporter permease [Pseudoduganella lurida]TWI67344.1 peptide/nickel transport system permease protein [Pseudoduganella lurida]